MAELITLARPYAKAAFDSARETKQLQQWLEALEIAAAVSLDLKVTALLSSPGLTSEQKSARFIEICGDKLDEKQQNFITVLAGHHRLALLPQIVELFDLYKANQEKTIEVDIQTAYEISSEMEATLVKALTSKLDREVKLQTTVQADLLGGALIRAGDTVIDGSVRGRLAKLAEAMNA